VGIAGVRCKTNDTITTTTTTPIPCYFRRRGNLLESFRPASCLRIRRGTIFLYPLEQSTRLIYLELVTGGAGAEAVGREEREEGKA
jgi:hypothetical protein